ncbi:hypothetical protein ACHAXR_005812 [Thalassiosira sp. AJA248-18]
MSPPSPSKMTANQAESLEAMRSCLQCQLCDKRINEPATLLSCAHSFCHGCILRYTENSWSCPLPGCRTPVTMKGGGREYVKTNPMISAVASSLVNIEQILATGPNNWWTGRNEDRGQNQGAVQFEDEEEVVDFQMVMDQENKRKREESSSSSSSDEDEDASDATKEFVISNAARDPSEGSKTLSIDQSLFDSGQSAKFNQKCAAPPEFSCSPIAMQSSQPDHDDDDRQTATASQLDRVLMRSAQKTDNTKSSPTPAANSSAKVQLEVIQSKQSASSCKKQRTSSTTSRPTVQSSLAKGPSPRRSRVSFQQQPRVMLLNPSWTLSNAHTRCLRKCANDGFISMLKMRSSDAFDDEDQFDSGFDFDTKEGRESFLAMLSSNRTDNCPPAPLSFYAISTEKDPNFSFGEAIIVPRSFHYYLAVACGLPIVDIEFLSSTAEMKMRGTMNHQRFPFPSVPGADEKKRGGRKHSQKDCLVLGASNYTWDAPKRAQTASLDRHSLWQKEEGTHARLETLLPGTDLLHDYSVLLLGGEFDQPNHSKRTVAKRRKQRDSEIKGGGYCTRGNISLLLQLCGAKVYDIDSVTTAKHIKKGLSDKQWMDIKNAKPLGASENDPTLNEELQSITDGSRRKTIVMVKDKSDAKLGSEFINQLNSVASWAGEARDSQICVVSCQWLLDSIGEFEAQDKGSTKMEVQNE